MNIVSSDTEITKKLSTIPNEILLPYFWKYFCELIKELKE